MILTMSPQYYTTKRGFPYSIGVGLKFCNYHQIVKGLILGLVLVRKFAIHNCIVGLTFA